MANRSPWQPQPRILVMLVAALGISSMVVACGVSATTSVAPAQSATPTAGSEQPEADQTQSTEAEVDALFRRMTLLLAPIVAVVLITVVLVHRRNHQHRL
jgi:hypothetical protein